MKLIFLGAPGAGKGTQAEIISEQLKVPVISTGNIIRAAIREGTPAGLKAKSYVDSGGLVPDEVVIDMLKDRIAQPDCHEGFILDGFPRTVPQAEALDRMGIVIDRVIDLEVSDEEIKGRLVDRRMCDSCGATYHLKNLPPKEQGKCDKCSGSLTQRKDDHPDTVAERLRVYHEQTEPLKGYYDAAGKLYVVEGQSGGVEATTRLVLAALEARVG